MLAGGYGQRGSENKGVGWGPLGVQIAQWATLSTVELPGLATSVMPRSLGMDFYARALRHALLAGEHQAPLYAFGGSFSSSLIYHFARLTTAANMAGSGDGLALKAMFLLGAPARLSPECRAQFKESIRFLEDGDTTSFVRQALTTLLYNYPSEEVHRQAAAYRILARAFGDAANSSVDRLRHIENVYRLTVMDHYPRDLYHTGPLQVRTLVGTGELDPLATVPECYALTKTLGAACTHFATIDYADHAVHLEQPAALSALMKWYFTASEDERQHLLSVPRGSKIDRLALAA